jgi:isoleucyl-tRNA synthetase
VNEVKQALSGADGSALHDQLERDGFIEVAGERLEAGDVDVRAQRHEAFALSEDDGWAVALDLDLDDELRAEGMARELVRALNDLRKDAGFEIADRIEVAIDAPADVQGALAPHADWIAGEVLAVSFALGPFDAGANTFTCTTELDGRMLDVALTKT